jgi:hypothetical protein
VRRGRSGGSSTPIVTRPANPFCAAESRNTNNQSQRDNVDAKNTAEPISKYPNAMPIINSEVMPSPPPISGARSAPYTTGISNTAMPPSSQRCR